MLALLPLVLQLLPALIGMVESILQSARDNSLLEAGQAEAIAAALTKAQAQVALARQAESDVEARHAKDQTDAAFDPTSSGKTEMRILIVLVCTAILSACAKQQAEPTLAVAAYSEVARPIYWSAKDTRTTKEQADRENAKWKRLCGKQGEPAAGE